VDKPRRQTSPPSKETVAKMKRLDEAGLRALRKARSDWHDQAKKAKRDEPKSP
jgi:hypothetical protein